MQQNETFPSITLKIENHTPKIVLHTQQNSEGKVLQQLSIGLDTLILDLAEKYGVNKDLNELISLIAQADELFLQFPDFDLSTHQTIDLDSLLNIAHKQAMELKPANVTQPELNNQLHEYWVADTIASTLEEIYNQLIAIALKHADLMGIEYIKLEDDRTERRLMEKMSKELAFGGVELIVTNLPEPLPEDEPETSA